MGRHNTELGALQLKANERELAMNPGTRGRKCFIRWPAATRDDLLNIQTPLVNVTKLYLSYHKTMGTGYVHHLFVLYRFVFCL